MHKNYDWENVFTTLLLPAKYKKYKDPVFCRRAQPSPLQHSKKLTRDRSLAEHAQLIIFCLVAWKKLDTHASITLYRYQTIYDVYSTSFISVSIIYGEIYEYLVDNFSVSPTGQS